MSFTQVVDIDPDAVVVRGGRVRTDYGDIQALAESMDSIGLINPIVVDRNAELVAGERRLLAAKLLGWRTIQARVIDGVEAETVELAENGHRKGFTPEEIGVWADRNWDAPWVRERSGPRRDILGQRIGVSGVQLERCRKLVLAARRNQADQDLLEIAANQGAKAAERELRRRQLETRTTAEIVGIHNCPPNALATKVSGERPVTLTVTQTTTNRLIHDVMVFADLCLEAGGQLLIGGNTRTLALVVHESPDFKRLLLAGTCIVHAPTGSRVYWRLSNRLDPEPRPDPEVFRADSWVKAMRKMVEAFSEEGDLVADPAMEHGETLQACHKRRFLGAEMDRSLIEQVARGVGVEP